MRDVTRETKAAIAREENLRGDCMTASNVESVFRNTLFFTFSSLEDIVGNMPHLQFSSGVNPYYEFCGMCACEDEYAISLVKGKPDLISNEKLSIPVFYSPQIKVPIIYNRNIQTLGFRDFWSECWDLQAAGFVAGYAQKKEFIFRHCGFSYFDSNPEERFLLLEHIQYGESFPIIVRPSSPQLVGIDALLKNGVV